MTVRELMNKLNQFPDDNMEVKVLAFSGDYESIGDVEWTTDLEGTPILEILTVEKLEDIGAHDE